MDTPHDALDALCGDVRLGRRDALPRIEGVGEAVPPPGTTLWDGGYAMVLLWPTERSPLRDAAISAQSWFDRVLSGRETPDKPMDGYLVLWVEEAPEDGAADADVNFVESSTQVCRKQIVWPSPTDATGWRGLDGVSVLGFPEPGDASEVASWPELDDEAAALWELIDALGPTGAADQDLKELGA